MTQCYYYCTATKGGLAISILEDWYNGWLYPAEKVGFSKNLKAQYRELQQQIDREEAHLEQQLSPEDQRRLNTLHDLLVHQTGLSDCANFIYGFRLGMRLMCEVVMGPDTN